jgi:excisionase family DNA binding protein
MKDTITQPMGVTAAAEYLGFSKTYLYKLVHLGKISYFKRTGGNKLFFRHDDLESFAFQGRRAADFELREKAEQLLANKKGCAL